MQFQDIFMKFLTCLATGVLMALAGFLIALAKKGFEWLTVKITGVKDENLREELKSALSILEQTVYNVVTSLQQTMGDEIRESIKNNDGKFTRDDLINLREIALQSVYDQLSQSTLDVLNKGYDHLQDKIYDMIETNVYDLKNRMIEISEVSDE